MKMRHQNYHYAHTARTIAALACMAMLTLTATASPRSKVQMKTAALQLLQQLHPSEGELPKELRRTEHYTVYGYEQSGFAILSNSDLMPEVIGYADTHFSEKCNEGLEWFLSQVEQIAAQAEATAQSIAKSPAPDPSRFPATVPALMSSTWGQEEPYWNYTPVDQRYGHCYTGCVATAIAQALYYHRYPPRGQGERTITYPLDGTTVKEYVTANFGETEYDWAHMRDSYADGNYTEQEASAVATLMLHCGVASRMNYSVNGSGTFTADAAYGLREYFGINTARAFFRSEYVSSDWMDMVYTELSEQRPIVYGATDRQQGFGHAFVIDGYDAEGRVHVNWGWDGDANGYFDIDLLDPKIYKFLNDHDMIAGIYGKPMQLQTATIHVEQAGQLAAMVDEASALTYADLTITDLINGTDLRWLRFMAGRDAQGHPTAGNLHKLDLSGARFVSGGEPYLTEAANEALVTEDDTLPRHAFYGCQALESIILPAGLKHWGTGALAMCMKLDSVSVGLPAPGADFTVDNGVVYDATRQMVIAVLPDRTGRLKLPAGTKALGEEAAAGCSKLKELYLPSSLTSIGSKALYYCSGLTELRVYALSVPTAGADAFGYVDPEKCQLAVRRDMAAAFKQAAEWSRFANHMREVYTLIQPRNATREYGEQNPKLGYQLSGDDVEGDPVLVCEAEPKSPVGRYVIRAMAGTIDDEAVEYGEGVLIVRRAPLTVRPADCQRRQGEPNPEFMLLYEGLKNDELEPEYNVRPTVSTTATEQSAPGIYHIIVGGGEAVNYSLSYQTGYLTIVDANGIVDVQDVRPTASSPLYTVQGRRVAAPTKKGVYIRNGKKLVLK